ncbi:ATP-binding cassette domain-containing protein [Microbacterium amylolyticum]|uniref:ABC-2 type transport system ATP-binding protein n=1 Tax=Microbacterium amylolyticum TaxID=936337 RepID=A0ABS4ZH53_9MICO|nr:ABC-2 type transport system ATP-binding protein [Microbacterium amylolyticum]
MIEAKQLTKRYGRRTVVDNVTFTACPGRVTALLGPNGSGKSTTMRLLLGLSIPASGEARILEQRFIDIPRPATRVGAMLDASAVHKGRSGREALVLAAMMLGKSQANADDMIDRVGLTAREARRRAGTYSLGMRQRLGIAQALLGEPEVLILDEPVNGLDPSGIRWTRDLLRDFADGGGTVLLSSHLLSEVELLADDVVIMGDGRVMAQGPKASLLEHGASTLEDAYFRWTSDTARERGAA